MRGSARGAINFNLFQIVEVEEKLLQVIDMSLTNIWQ